MLSLFGRIVVNTSDRLAARKALMQSFRTHLEHYKIGGKHCGTGCNEDISDDGAIEIDQMMKSKFNLTWRHYMFSLVYFMSLLLLAFIYIDNTTWEDSWYRTSTKYDVKDLLNTDHNEIVLIDPKHEATKTAKNDANSKDDKYNISDKMTKKKGKVTKKNAKKNSRTLQPLTKFNENV